MEGTVKQTLLAKQILRRAISLQQLLGNLVSDHLPIAPYRRVWPGGMAVGSMAMFRLPHPAPSAATRVPVDHDKDRPLTLLVPNRTVGRRGARAENIDGPC